MFNKTINELYLTLTYRCNLNCPYCFTKSSGYYNLNKDMEEETAYQSIDELLKNSESKYLAIKFFGGEPLLRFDLIQKITEYAKQQAKARDKKFHFIIYTNGVLFEDNIINYFNQNNFIIRLNAEYLNTANLDSNKLIPILQKLDLCENIKTILVFRFSPVHFEIFKTIEFLKAQAKIKNLIISILPLTAFEEDSPFLFKSDEYASYKEKIMNFIQNNILNISKKEKPFIEFLDFDAKQKLEDSPELFQFKDYFCQAGRHSLTIDINGDIYPCERMVNQSKFCFGNINQGIKEIKYSNFMLQTMFSDKKIPFSDFYCPHENWLFNKKFNKIPQVYIQRSLIFEDLYKEYRKLI